MQPPLPSYPWAAFRLTPHPTPSSFQSATQSCPLSPGHLCTDPSALSHSPRARRRPRHSPVRIILPRRPLYRGDCGRPRFSLQPGFCPFPRDETLGGSEVRVKSWWWCFFFYSRGHCKQRLHPEHAAPSTLFQPRERRRPAEHLPTQRSRQQHPRATSS